MYYILNFLQDAQKIVLDLASGLVRVAPDIRRRRIGCMWNAGSLWFKKDILSGSFFKHRDFHSLKRI